MKLLGLSSLDAMLTLLLVDGAWWTIVFMERYFPIFLYYVRYMLDKTTRTNFTGISALVFGGILLLRFKAPCLLLVTVLKNRVNEHCHILKIWYWVSVFLDVALIGLHVAFSLMLGGLLSSALVYVFFFMTIRGLLWSLARSMVRELGSTENTLFPVPGWRGVFDYLGTRTESLVKVLVSFEILWNVITMLSIGVDVSMYFLDGYERSKFGGLFPIPEWSSIMNLVGPPYFFVICGIQLLGIEKGWKTFLKFWLVVYLVGIIGFALGMGSELLFSYIYLYPIRVIINGLLRLGQLTLKVILVISMVKYLRGGTRPEEEGDNEVFMQPLLPKEILAGKDAFKPE